MGWKETFSGGGVDDDEERTFFPTRAAVLPVRLSLCRCFLEDGRFVAASRWLLIANAWTPDIRPPTLFMPRFMFAPNTNTAKNTVIRIGNRSAILVLVGRPPLM